MKEENKGKDVRKRKVSSLNIFFKSKQEIAASGEVLTCRKIVKGRR